MIRSERNLADQSCLTCKLQDTRGPECQFSSSILNVLNLKMLYEKLPCPTSTRLINLLPGAPDDPLECQLLVIDLESDHVQYPAISYVWGDPSDKKSIHCMNEALLIPSSLHAFLKTRRDGAKPWICWADAICINQSGDEEALRERAHQVEMMGTIFSKAKVVLVYLGEEPTGFEEFRSASSALLKLLLGNIDPQRPSLDFLKVTADKVISSLVLDTFDEIMTRPWYQRVWTLQEFVLAQDLEICIGRGTISYHAWRATSLIFDHFYSDLEYRRFKERSVHTDRFKERSIRIDHNLQDRYRCTRQYLYECRDIYKQDTTMSLSRFTEATLQLNTTNVRDRLYGGYGILDHSVMQIIPIDYGISSSTLSHQLSALLLVEGNFTFVLQHCTGLNDRVPTWCISLDDPRLDRRESYGSTIALSCTYGIYSAAGKSKQSSSITLTEPRIVAASGCILEEINFLTSPLPALIDETDAASTQHEFLAFADWTESTLLWLGEIHGLPAGKQSWHKIPTQASWTPTITALCRTLIQDVLASNQVVGNLPKPEPPSRPNKVPTRLKADSVTLFLAWLHFCHELQQHLRSGTQTKLWTVEDFEKCGIDRSWMDWAIQFYSSAEKRVGVLISKRLALLPNEAKIGDEICIFEGVNAPFVIRKSGERYKIVGSCYLHGMMDGEALKRDDWKPKRILIE
jgi:hypothetical protein